MSETNDPKLVRDLLLGTCELPEQEEYVGEALEEIVRDRRECIESIEQETGLQILHDDPEPLPDGREIL